MLNSIVPLLSGILSFTFAFYILKRYLERKGTYLLIWGIGSIFYGIGGLSEAYYGFLGWNPLVFRLWYLFGAILVAAWLGQGTVFLLARRKWANTLLVILILGSLYGAFKIFTAQLDPAMMTASIHTGSELSGRAITSPGVRILTPFFNMYGTMTLVGGAAYSAFIFWRKRILLHRTIGNILIAVGATLPAFGGFFSRLQVPGALYMGEFLGILLLFAGFLRATTPMKSGSLDTVPAPVE
jgi:hypothetical protein